jgi:thiamine biosynthesis lipoprotein ApbE
MLAALPRPIQTLTRWFRAARPLPVFTFHYENALGTSLELRIRAASSEHAEQAEQRALAEIDRLESIFSIFDPASELRQWQRRVGVPIRLSPELWAVLQDCERWQECSGGAFHPASEGYSRLWREAAERNTPPTLEEIAAARTKAAQRLWYLDPATETATYLSDGPLSLNAIAKGYIVDHACAAAFPPDTSIDGVILNIGGDLRIQGDASEIVGITDPNRDAENAAPVSRIRVRNVAVATSGDGRRGFQIGSTFHSHILDPRTGMPAAQIRNASVLAPNAADADALATIFSVLAPEESIRLADSLPNVGCLLIAHDGRCYRNSCWRSHEIPPHSPN